MADLMPQFIINWVNWFVTTFQALPDTVQYLTITVLKILAVTVVVILCVAFSTYFERKVIGSLQAAPACCR